jgi:hypothetical protein
LQDLFLLSASLSAVPCQSGFWDLLAHIRRNPVPLLKAQTRPRLATSN